MVECGRMEDPPNLQVITVWGIVTFVIMFVVGVGSVMGLINGSPFSSLYSALSFIGSFIGAVGLVFIILSLVQKIANYMKTGAFCFMVSSIIHIVFFVFFLFGDAKLNFSSILQLALDIFLCYLFFVQSKGFNPATATANDTPQ